MPWWGWSHHSAMTQDSKPTAAPDWAVTGAPDSISPSSSYHHPAMTVTVHLQPGESISQALIRSGVMIPPDGEQEVIRIPPGTCITNANLRRTRIIERRTTWIPFLGFGANLGV